MVESLSKQEEQVYLQQESCKYLQLYGYCLLKEGCPNSHNTVKFNVDAPVFQKPVKQPEQAKELIQAELATLMKDQDLTEEQKLIEQQILADAMEQEKQERLLKKYLVEFEDANVPYMPGQKDCQCCKGYVYTCYGDICSELGVCYCMAHLAHNEDIL